MSKLLNAIYKNPIIQGLPRSKFDFGHSMKTTIKAGLLYPIDIQEIIPGDTVENDTSSVIRSVLPFTDTMDNAYLDIFTFFVPYRLCYYSQIGTTDTAHHWEHINGQNDSSPWARTSEATALMITPCGNTIGSSSINTVVDSVAHHFGIPLVGNPLNTYNAAPFNALGLIWNNFFRDENTQNQLQLNTVEFYQSCFTGNPFYVNKFHDYFTSCLPSPQKGDAVNISLGTQAPVEFSKVFYPLRTTDSMTKIDDSGVPVLLQSISSAGTTYGSTLFVGGTSSSTYQNNLLTQASTVNPSSVNQRVEYSNLGISVKDNDAYVDLASATGITINQLRYAFATQRLLEADARGGTRYIEVLQTHYNQFIRDEVIQYPEYVGGKRIPLNTYQVPGTAETDSSELGEIGAFGHTQDTSKTCMKSFKEHGYLITLCCVRSVNSYYQGVPKLFMKKRRFDNYYPEFANIGEQAVKKAEIYAASTSSYESVLGYQEAWAEYRYPINRLTGYFAPDSGDTYLKSDSYAQVLSAMPTLNESFIKFDRNAILKTWKSSSTEYDYYCDFYFNMKITRPMPVYSIPGLNRL